jgi:hypothetical protein
VHSHSFQLRLSRRLELSRTSHFHKSLGISQKNTGKSENGAEIRILEDKIKTEKSDSERLCHSAVEDCRTGNENLKWYSTMLYLEDGC